MSDSLRARIAAVQETHLPCDYAGYIECGCGVECKPDHGGIDVAEQLWAAHVADAVIAELGLEVDLTYLSDDKTRRYFELRGFYQMAWKADDE